MATTLTLGHLIDAAPNTSGDDIAALQAIVANHPKAAAVSLDDLIGAYESPIKTAAIEVEHTAESIASKVWHWGGDELAKLENMLKGHPNRLPDAPPAPVTPPAAPEPTAS